MRVCSSNTPFISVREKHHIVVQKHPYAESLNKKLLNDIELFNFYYRDNNLNNSNIFGSKCSLLPHQITPSMQIVLDWVEQILSMQWNNFYSMNSKINMSTWFAKYNKGEYARDHNHELHAHHAFAYFVKCPKGSSPLVFTTSNKKIKAHEGKVVIFPGNLYHHVPKNNCDDRIVFVGNIRV